MKAYPAIFHKEDGAYWVEFPDLEGCLVQEDTFEEAMKSAHDVLSAFLECLDSRKIKINPPSDIHGDNVYYIDVDINTAFAITLKHAREEQGLTQKQVAEKMGVSWAQYQRIENPRKTNPTLKTIDKLSKIFNRNFLTLT